MRPALFGSSCFPRDKVNLFKNGTFNPAGPRQYALPVFTHAGMPAKVSSGCLRAQAPFRNIYANQIIHAPRLPLPSRVFPRTADRGHIFEPRNFRGDALQLFAISKLPRPAPTLQAIKFVRARHDAVAVFPVLV